LPKQDLMRSNLKRDLDPFDLELIERAFESAQVMVKDNPTLSHELDSDEELEATLRRELIEIALVHGITDAETLRDILISKRSELVE
jgi:hypothetical protein